jgi:hypothetical protein
LDKKPLLSDLLREVAKFAPDYMIDEENDGNIIIILNMHLENSRLVPFEGEDEIDEAASGRD